MKERPILFNAPMVRAILDGSKTQTRRVVKQKYLPWIENSFANFLDGKWNQRPLPYGQIGDRLWGRETHAIRVKPEEATDGNGRCWYYADAEDPGAVKWHPSIHMPRWASRILLEITGVRVERLQDISEDDAISEGIEKHETGLWLPCAEKGKAHIDPRRAYRDIWESINGPGSWDVNPWVWVIEFEVITA